MNDLDQLYWQGYDKGYQQAVLELEEVYGEGIRLTDAWKEAFRSDKEDND